MAHTTHTYKNSHNGQTRQAPEGFSWTVFFFGVFPPLFRQDFAGFAIMLLAAVVTFGLSNLVFMFTYNSWYINRLADNGYVKTSGT